MAQITSADIAIILNNLLPLSGLENPRIAIARVTIIRMVCNIFLKSTLRDDNRN